MTKFEMGVEGRSSPSPSTSSVSLLACTVSYLCNSAPFYTEKKWGSESSSHSSKVTPPRNKARLQDETELSPWSPLLCPQSQYWFLSVTILMFPDLPGHVGAVRKHLSPWSWIHFLVDHLFLWRVFPFSVVPRKIHQDFPPHSESSAVAVGKSLVESVGWTPGPGWHLPVPSWLP